MKPTKNLNFLNRFKFAASGISAAFQKESSLKTHFFAVMCLIVSCVYFKPRPIWCALFAAVSVLVIGLEMVNSAVEAFLDHTYPDFDPTVKYVKDVLAGAVLVASFGALIVFGIYVFTISK